MPVAHLLAPQSELKRVSSNRFNETTNVIIALRIVLLWNWLKKVSPDRRVRIGACSCIVTITITYFAQKGSLFSKTLKKKLEVVSSYVWIYDHAGDFRTSRNLINSLSPSGLIRLLLK